MLKLFTCQQGHFWEASLDGNTPDTPPPCPECGAPPDSLPLLDLLPPEDVPCEASPPGPVPAEGVTDEIPEALPASTHVTVTPLAPRVDDLPLCDEKGWPTVAGFEIVQSLGRGPTGVRNYRARQLLVNRNVILRVVLAQEDPGQSAWGSLRAEASALGRLHHPYIITIHEAGERNRQLFYNAVEDVPGPTLAEELAERPLPVPQAVALVEALARAVHHAHEEDVIHRNLKPSSVLLREPGEGDGRHGHKHDLSPPFQRVHKKAVVPLLTGFGLTRRAMEGDVIDHELFADEEGYLSPEQVWGRARDLGRTTDVYGLGGILLFALTGRAPYRGADTSDVLDTIQSAEVPSPSRFRSGISPDLDAICRKCLAKNPRRRYASALEVAEELGRLRQGLPVKARPLGTLPRLRKWAGRRPALAGLLLLLGLFFPALLIAYSGGQEDGKVDTWEYNRARQSEQRAWGEVDRLRAQLNGYQEKEQAEAYRRWIAEARQALARNDHRQARISLEQCDPTQRRWEWHYLNQVVDGSAPLSFDQIARPVTAVKVQNGYLAAAGKVQLAPGFVKGEVCIWNLSDRRKVFQKNDFHGPVRALALDPQGPRVAFASPQGPRDRGDVVETWQFGGGFPARNSITPFGGPIPDLAFPIDGRGVLVTDQSGRLMRIDARTGRISAPFVKARFQRGTGTQLALSPDGRQVASLTLPGQEVEVWDTNGGSPRPLNAHNPQAICVVGKEWLAVSQADLTVRLFPLYPSGRWQDPQPAKTLAGHKGVVRHLAATSDGKRLATSAADGVKVWDVDSGKELVTLTGFGAQAPPLAFTPGGKALAIGGDRGVVVWGNARD
jgi:serine/threonine protein kinase/WD40 repeat protein